MVEKKQIKVYVAGGWFTPEQEEALDSMLRACKLAEVDFYSPRDDGLYVPGVTDPKDVFQENLKQILLSDIVIASTEGKDMGTVWECGYAYGISKPVAYFYPNRRGKFNLMLAQSGVAVFSSPVGIVNYLRACEDTGTIIDLGPYRGEIE